MIFSQPSAALLPGEQMTSFSLCLHVCLLDSLTSVTDTLGLNKRSEQKQNQRTGKSPKTFKLWLCHYTFSDAKEMLSMTSSLVTLPSPRRCSKWLLIDALPVSIVLDLKGIVELQAHL